MFSNLQQIPNAGRLPELSNVPPILRPTVTLLGLLPSVDSVVTTILLQQQSAVILITFASGQVPDYRRALQCFRGLRLGRMDSNRELGYMLLSIGQLGKA